METAVSITGVPIRLTYERWYHITENHEDLASYFHEVLETVEGPDVIVQGNGGSYKAAKNYGRNKWMVAVYREISKSDGFVITAYFLSTKPKGRNYMASTLTRETESFVTNCLVMASDMLRLPTKQTWIDYDKEADVLYMSFRKPQRATDTVEMDEDVLLRKDGKDIVGITIMNASARSGKIQGEILPG